MTTTDQLAAIEARAQAYADHGTPGLAAPADRAYLLAMVREQTAASERVRALHRGNRWGFCEECSGHVNIAMPCPTTAALTATEGADTRGERAAATDAELHARRQHPLWEYETTEGQRKSWDDADTPPEGDGWERNTDAGRNGWDRFDYTEESYWRRLRPSRGGGE